MYGYDYEYGFLLSLRVMKYLHQQNPAALEAALNLEDWFEEEAMPVLAEYLIWKIFPEVVMYEDDDNGIEIAEFSHPALYRFLDLCGKWSSACGGSTGAGQRKLSDAVGYFLSSTYSVCDVDCLFYSESARIKVWFSPDCYDSLEFGNALVDLLLWLQKENERLEGMLKEAEYGKEAA